MAAITVRNLDDDVQRRLKVRAAANGRSMEAEARDILTAAVTGGSMIVDWIDAVSDIGVEPPERTAAVRTVIEPRQRERLERTAASRGVSVGTLVRSAIDLAYPPGSARRSRAADAILAAAPMDVPDPEDLRVELDRLRGRE